MKIEFDIDEKYFRAVKKLPWELPLGDWRDSSKVKHLNIRKGLSRHLVIFVEVDRFKLAIKETSARTACKEIAHFEEMQRRQIPTLLPIGTVIRTEAPMFESTPFGVQKIENRIGHTITLLAEKVLPDSLLYGRGFKTENRNKIWNAVARLFATLHLNGIYWGDASLANMLIQFRKERVPKLGKITVIKAYLSDAETVEIPGFLSDSLKEMDLEFFFESMDWVLEDLRQAGITRGPLDTATDKKYIRHQYDKLIAIHDEIVEFERKTHLKVKAQMGEFSEEGYSETMLKHIEEHKWYIAENDDGAVSLPQAARDWYINVFLPICNSFKDQNLLEQFPGKTATDLYVEIMQNKYFLSEKEGGDVGFLFALEDYCQKYGLEVSDSDIFSQLRKAVLSILGTKEEELWEALQKAVV